MARDAFTRLPAGLPVPKDDGASLHLTGLRMPPVELWSTADRVVNVAEAARRLSVFFFYPRTGRPGERIPAGWDRIPGARGCTPQSCAFRDRFPDFARRGVRVFGVSCQGTAFQKELVARTRLPYEVLSDRDFVLADTLRLPTFAFNGMRLIRRLTLVADRRRVVKVFYPVFPPDRNAAAVLAWIDSSLRESC
jgi:peroxiredoxin